MITWLPCTSRWQASQPPCLAPRPLAEDGDAGRAERAARGQHVVLGHGTHVPEPALQRAGFEQPRGTGNAVAALDDGRGHPCGPREAPAPGEYRRGVPWAHGYARLVVSGAPG